MVVRLLALAVLLFASCHSAPSKASIAAADIGTPPEFEAAKAFADSYVRQHLIDPTAPLFRWGTQLEKGWFREFAEKPRFCWRLDVGVNSKNRMGGYTGEQVWAFFFLNNSAIGAGVPQPAGSSTYMSPQEFDPPIPLQAAAIQPTPSAPGS